MRPSPTVGHGSTPQGPSGIFSTPWSLGSSGSPRRNPSRRSALRTWPLPRTARWVQTHPPLRTLLRLRTPPARQGRPSRAHRRGASPSPTTAVLCHRRTRGTGVASHTQRAGSPWEGASPFPRSKHRRQTVQGYLSAQLGPRGSLNPSNDPTCEGRWADGTTCTPVCTVCSQATPWLRGTFQKVPTKAKRAVSIGSAGTLEPQLYTRKSTC